MKPIKCSDHLSWRLLNTKNEAGFSTLLIMAGVAITALTAFLSVTQFNVFNSQTISVTTKRNLDASTLTAEITQLLNDTATCQGNFMGTGDDLRSSPISVTSLKRQDATVLFQTGGAVKYSRSDFAINSIRLQNYSASANDPLKGKAYLVLEYEGPIISGTSQTLVRLSPIEVDVASDGTLQSCQSILNDETLWQLDASTGGVYRMDPGVGIGTDTPTAALTIKPTASLVSALPPPASAGKHNFSAFGTNDPDGAVLFHMETMGPTRRIIVPTGNRHVFQTGATATPVIYSNSTKRISVGYTRAEPVDYELSVKAVSSGAYVDMSNEAGDRWSFSPGGASQENLMISSPTSSTASFVIDHPNPASGYYADVRIGSEAARPASDYVFWVAGLAGGNSAWQDYSDRRLKKNIRPLEGSLEAIEKIDGYTYRLKEGPSDRQMGVIAQELDAVPELKTAVDCKGKYCTVRYNQLVAPIAGSAIELASRQEKLENKILRLKNRLSAH